MTDEFSRAVLMVPAVAKLMAVIALCPAESVFVRAFAVVAVVAVVADEAFPVKAPVNVVADTDVRPDMEPPVIETLLEFCVDIVPKPNMVLT